MGSKSDRMMPSAPPSVFSDDFGDNAEDRDDLPAVHPAHLPFGQGEDDPLPAGHAADGSMRRSDEELILLAAGKKQGGPVVVTQGRSSDGRSDSNEQVGDDGGSDANACAPYHLSQSL